MYMYNTIKNPFTNRFVSIYSKLGKNILQNYILLIGGSNISLPLEKTTIPVSTLISESFNYTFNSDLSEDSAYGYIFLHNKENILLKCLVINEETEQFKTNLGIYKETVKPAEFFKECNILKKMGELEIGPKVFNYSIINRTDFKKMLESNYKIFDLDNKSNLLEEKYIDECKKQCINNLEFGIITMEYLKGYNSLLSKKLKDNKIELCPKFNKRIDDMHGEDIRHCDLHSGNVLLSENESDIKIIDFGRSIFVKNTSELNRIAKEKYCKKASSHYPNLDLIKICN